MEFPFSATAAFCSGCLFGAISAYMAHRRERNPYAWFFIGFFFGIFGVLGIFFAPAKKKQPSLATLEAAAESALPTIQGSKDKFWYYLDPSNQQQGPMSYSALNSAWKEGKVNLSTFVWNEDFADWKILKDLLHTENRSSAS